MTVRFCSGHTLSRATADHCATCTYATLVGCAAPEGSMDGECASLGAHLERAEIRRSHAYRQATEEDGTIRATIPVSGLAEIRKLVDRQNRRCAKHAMPLLVLEVGPEYVATATATTFDPTYDPVTHRYVSRYDEAATHYRAVDVRLAGVAPVIAGWRVVATLDPKAAGNMIRMVPGVMTEIPERYVHAGTRCDHCGTTRTRKDTVLVENVDTGEFQQVGRSCLRDFLGHASPEEMIAIADTAMHLLGRSPTYGGGFEEDEIYSLAHYLAYVAWATRTHGWVSKAAARESEYRRTATAVEADARIDDERTARRRGKALAPVVTDEDVATATAAIAWAATDLSPRSEFEYNLRTLAQSTYIAQNDKGTAAAMVMCHGRVLADRLRAETALPPVAAIGARPTFEATLVAIRPYEGAYGMVYFVEFDADGRRVVWPASTYPTCNPGDRVRVTATVKSHEEYRGVITTRITRAKMALVAPAAGATPMEAA